MNDDSIATHMYCHVLSVLLTGQKKKKKKKKKRDDSVQDGLQLRRADLHVLENIHTWLT